MAHAAAIDRSARHSRRHIRYGTKTSRNGFHDAAIPRSTPHQSGFLERSAIHAPVTSSNSGHATWPSRRLAYAACVTSTLEAIATAWPGAVSRATCTSATGKRAKLTAHQAATAAASGARNSGAIIATIHGGFRFGPRFASNGT